MVAAAVIIPEGIRLEGIRDSKQMSENEREAAFSSIQRQVLAAGIGVVSNRDIDEFNILRASLEAMKMAILALDPSPEFCLIDGIYSVRLNIPQQCIKKGDQVSRTISAASVMAKVYRDRIMRAHHDRYPEYGFHENKGYGTRRHMAALREIGPSPLHRLTFRGVL